MEMLSPEAQYGFSSGVGAGGAAASPGTKFRQGIMRRAHPERYSSESQQNGGANPRPASAITSLMRPLIQKFPAVTMTQVCRAAGVKVPDAGTAPGFRGPSHEEDRVCLNYVCGNCAGNGCPHAHLWENELPRGYAENLVRMLRPGVDKLMATRELPVVRRQKRQRTGYDQGQGRDAGGGARHGGGYGRG